MNFGQVIKKKKKKEKLVQDDSTRQGLHLAFHKRKLNQIVASTNQEMEDFLFVCIYFSMQQEA